MLINVSIQCPMQDAALLLLASVLIDEPHPFASDPRAQERVVFEKSQLSFGHRYHYFHCGLINFGRIDIKRRLISLILENWNKPW